MDREQLGKMNLEALRLLASERGLSNARALGRGELIDRLAPKSVVERAQEAIEHAGEAVAHAAEALEEKAHAVAERLLHPTPAPPPVEKPAAVPPVEKTAAAPVEKPAAFEPANRPAPSARFDVPSSTVHPRTPTPAPPPSEPAGMLDFSEPPETYGVDECEVLFQDPAWVFAYWEVTEPGLQAARAQLGQSAGAARLVLRLFTTVAGADGVERDIRDIDLNWNHGRRYLPAPRAGAHLRIAVGLLSPEGYFAPIAHSSLTRVPPSQPTFGPVEWMEVVPAKLRGRTREPLVLVRRAGEHHERGVRGELGQGGAAAGTSPAERGAPKWGGASSGARPPGDSGSH
jgi:hypothetical protein